MSVRIEVPKEIWPYGPATALLENDIRDLLKEIPGLRYGMIEGLYPCVYWDTPLARFAVIPQFFKMVIRHFPLTDKLTYYGPKPMTIVIFDVVLGKHVIRIFSIPCLVPALGRYITVPMEAVVQVREKIYIKPELVEFKTEFYSGVHSIYDLVRDLLRGEAEKLAEENIIASLYFPRIFFIEEWRQIIHRIKMTREEIKEVITNHITSTTLIPRERVESILGVQGYVHDMLRSEEFSLFLQDEPTAIPAYLEILSNEDAFLQKYLVAQFIHHNIEIYREYLSMKDLCEEGMNKPYEETIKGHIIGEVSGDLPYLLNIHGMVKVRYRSMLLPHIPDTRGLEPWLLERTLMRPGHPFREKWLKEFAESVAKEILEEKLKIENKPMVNTLATNIRIEYLGILDRDLPSFVGKAYSRRPPIIYPEDFEDFFTEPLISLIRDMVKYRPAIYAPRILTELYDKPIYILGDIFSSTGDYLALALHDSLQKFIDVYPYNAWEAVRSRFGLRGVEIKPQRLYSRR
jgi:hypothetical protein